MSDNLGTYSFLPWVREGLANNISSADGDTNVKVRAQMPIKVTLTGTKADNSTGTDFVDRNLSIYGPGDIIGIDDRAVIRTEPRNYITNYEPNYLSFIEFYDEDFPWRYTPAKPDTSKHRLRPWITLVILKEGEFKEGTNIQGKPLPYFELDGVNSIDVFPDAEQLWAWAHVHVNKDISGGGSPSVTEVASALKSTLAADPDQAYSRLVCPRRLEDKQGYHAFLIPTFETGRLAGLGEEIPDTTVATAGAWASGQASFPYYHRWYFKTGNEGDFEYLVNLLKPMPSDKRVGTRDIDVLHPGSDLPEISLPAEIEGVLKLGGALKVPFATLPAADQAEVLKYDTWDENPYPHPFETAVAERINLADDYLNEAAEVANADGSPDPIVTLPLYGRWHALTDRLLVDENGANLPNNKNWVHELNLDPRYRVAGGLGTGVVQKNQEAYMNAAWEQVGDVIAANNRLRLAQLAAEVSFFFHKRHVETLPLEKKLLFLSPVQRRIISEGTTIYGQIKESKIPYTMTSAPFRKVTRSGATIMKRIPFTSTASPANLLAQVNAGKVLPAPVKAAPTEVTTVDDLANELAPLAAPAILVKPLRKNSWIRFIPLILLAILIILFLIFRPFGLIGGAMLVVAGVLVWLFLQLNKWTKAVKAAEVMTEAAQTPAAVDDYPKSPNFKLSLPTDKLRVVTGVTDSAEAARFKDSLRDAFSLLAIKFPDPVKKTLDLGKISTNMVAAVNPKITIPARTYSYLDLPKWILNLNVESFTPVMAYPVFDQAMYKPLSKISSELFLPNINLVAQNSITLLESNQRFIESYMVGLNHEMGRELLWREYPTDQRGSYFRQFWEVNTAYKNNPPTEAEKETLRDIPEIHKWSKSSALGAHNHRNPTSDPDKAGQLVLVIRGELLKKYPNAVIYAQKAKYVLKADGSVNKSKDRELCDLTAAEESSLPADKIQFPLFEAKVDPDIYFFGFDLDAEEVKGMPGDNPGDNPGWYFVIKERPGEPRFGLDIASGSSLPRLYNWNKLSWEHVGTAEGECIEINSNIALNPDPTSVDPDTAQNPQDASATWNVNTNAAELAYILYQVPVMVAVHGSRMLS